MESSNSETTVNLNSNELDPETIRKLKGDAIGSTMYSERFVLKTLLGMSNLKWDEKFEEDLCFLWDMTLEEEVCEFLLKVAFPSIAADCLTKYDEKRFIEIIIGILGNLVSKFKIDEEKVISSVLGWLQTDDHLILIQIMRFLKGVDHFENKEKLGFITKEIIEKFQFILSSSVNLELLSITLDVLAKITTGFKVDINLLNKEIISDTLVGYKEIKKLENNDDDNHTLHFVQFVMNICLYSYEFNNGELQEGIVKNKNELSSVLCNILCLTLNNFQCDFEPIDDTTEFYIEAIAIIFPVVKIGSTKEIFRLLTQTISRLIKNSGEFTRSFIDLFLHFISVTEIENIIEYIENDLTSLNPILEYCEKNNKDYNKIVNKIDKLKTLEI